MALRIALPTVRDHVTTHQRPHMGMARAQPRRKGKEACLWALSVEAGRGMNTSALDGCVVGRRPPHRRR